mmetsp:Transcript_61328/g.142697  ORF Transcript_61328/g.142697 Transcript_61328/m.142697 type:complete len:162 (-) Transcript_61328:49-534(-)
MPAEGLAERLQAVGVEAPPAPGSPGCTDEAWRRCLAELCAAYLGSRAPEEPVVLSTEQQLQALHLRAEAFRQRNFNLRLQLDAAERQEAALQRQAGQQPLENALACLHAVRDGCAEAEELLKKGQPKVAVLAGLGGDLGDVGVLLSALRDARERLCDEGQS